MSSKLKSGIEMALPSNASLFFVKGEITPCNCPSYLCHAEIGEISQSRTAPTRIEYRDCDGKVKLLKSFEGELEDGTFSVGEIIDLDENNLIDWFNTGCEGTFIIVRSNQCTAVSDYSQGDHYTFLNGAFPTSITEDEVTGDRLDTEAFKRILKRSVEVTFYDRTVVRKPKFSTMKGLNLQTAVSGLSFSKNVGCGSGSKCDAKCPCEELFILDKEDVTCNGIIHTNGCGCGSDEFTTITHTAPILSINPSTNGLVVTTEETEDPDYLGGTNTGYLPYGDICDGAECIVDAYEVMKTASLATTTYGDAMWNGGSVGELVYTDLTSGSTVISETMDDILGDITAINTNDGEIAWFGTSLGEVGFANDTDYELLTTPPEQNVAVNSIAMLDSETAVVGTATGNLWITTDCGKTWDKACVGCGLATLASISFICMADCRTGYIVGTDSSGKVQVFWTNDAFCSCRQVTNKSGGNKLTSTLKITEVTACAVCPESGQLVIGGLYNGTPTVISG